MSVALWLSLCRPKQRHNETLVNCPGTFSEAEKRCPKGGFVQVYNRGARQVHATSGSASVCLWLSRSEWGSTVFCFSVFLLMTALWKWIGGYLDFPVASRKIKCITKCRGVLTLVFCVISLENCLFKIEKDWINSSINFMVIYNWLEIDSNCRLSFIYI